jgi:uncharacterized protein with PIN domain
MLRSTIIEDFHAAALNLGEGLTCATARPADPPRPCRGDEFTTTDGVIA